MNNLRITLSLACIVMSLQTFGQDYTFKVLVNKGKNEVKSNDVWQLIKTGTSLKSNDELKITENSYLGLIHVTGKPLEVKQAGKYKVVDLASQINGGSSVLNKYTDFILSANTQKKNNLSATGAVHRGPKNLSVYLPKTEAAIVYNNKVVVNWDTENVPAPYIVTFNSMFGDELKKVETMENNIAIDLNDNSFLNEDNIIVVVSSKTDPNKISDEYTLKKLSRADKERIKNLFNEIKNQVADENAMSKYVLAGFYEQNNLFIDAITAYMEAIKLAPDVPEYKADYNAFLIRNAIKEESVKK